MGKGRGRWGEGEGEVGDPKGKGEVVGDPQGGGGSGRREGTQWSITIICYSPTTRHPS